jgi:hypothetical protein
MVSTMQVLIGVEWHLVVQFYVPKPCSNVIKSCEVVMNDSSTFHLIGSLKCKSMAYYPSGTVDHFCWDPLAGA